MTRILALMLCLTIADSVALAERLPLSEAMDLPDVTYDPSVPSPEQVLGHQVGSRHTRPDQIVSYFDAVAAASERVQVLRHGESYEGRPLIHAVITAPENQHRLELLRQGNLRLTHSSRQVSDGDLQGQPAVVWLGYSVHGNEASPAEAALLVLYHLAAGQGRSVEEILEQCIVLVVPMLNPDGRSRFVEWVNSARARVAVDDPQHREHGEPWPGGRTNHFWFDLNRDWLPARLRETQGRLELYHQWKPQLLTDHHEMGSEATFFFQPGVPSRNNPNTPAATLRLTEEIARFHARRLDEIGSLYYSEESFDDFYYGKGSTYPDINGAVGILFEQATSRALIRETRSGQITYGSTIRNQFVVSLSTLEAAVGLRVRLLQNQRDFYREALAEAAAAPFLGWVFPLDRSGVRVSQLLETLLRHRIEVRELSHPLELGDRRFTPGSAFLVPARQPQWRLLKTLLEQVTEFGDQVFYDVSTWSLPSACGIEAVGIPVGLSDPFGERITEMPAKTGRLLGPSPAYAFLLDWRQDAAPEALYELLSRGLQARLMTRPAQFEVSGGMQDFPRGTIVVPAGSGREAIEAVRRQVDEVVQRYRVEVQGVTSGFSQTGPDLGSPSVPVLVRPRPAVIAGDGVRAAEAGEAWFELAEVRGLPVSLLAPERLEMLELSRYNVLILPGGSHQRISDAGASALKAWVRGGGQLIAIAGGVRWVLEKGLVDERRRERPQTRIDAPFEAVPQARQAATIPGSIFRVNLDTTHPLAFGLPETVTVFRDHELLVEPSETPGATVGRYVDSPLVSGYVPADLQQLLPGSASVIARRDGRGAIVLFMANPNFRAFWPVTSRMFLNAVFFGGTY